MHQLRFLIATISIAFLPISPVSAQTSDANTIKDMFVAMTKCWRPPAGSENLEVTVSLSLNATGGIIGKPRVTHSKLDKDESLNKQFVNSVFTSIEQCTPVKITAALGGAIAGRMLTLLYRLPPKPV